MKVPSSALDGLGSYEENGVLCHVGPFGTAVSGPDGFSVTGVPIVVDEAEAVHIVAFGVPRLPDYGPVRIIGGPHCGKVGYYDDDDDDGRRYRACVYFGTPFGEHWEAIPHRWIVEADVKLATLERLRRDEPGLYAVMRLPE